MANESVTKTFVVALTLCIVCAVVVSSAAVLLRPAQEAYARDFQYLCCW